MTSSAVPIARHSICWTRPIDLHLTPSRRRNIRRSGLRPSLWICRPNKPGFSHKDWYRTVNGLVPLFAVIDRFTAESLSSLTSRPTGPLDCHTSHPDASDSLAMPLTVADNRL